MAATIKDIWQKIRNQFSSGPSASTRSDNIWAYKDYYNSSSDIIGILNAGEDPDTNTPGQDGFKLLHIASGSNNGKYDIAELLIMRGADINVLNGRHDTPAHRAAPWSNNDRVLKLLIQHKADPNIQNVHHNTALHIAIGFRNIENVKILLEAKANCNIVNKEGLTPLELARTSGLTDIAALIEEHLKREAEVDISEQVERKSQKPKC